MNSTPLPHLWCALTQEEWKAVYALGFTWMDPDLGESYPLLSFRHPSLMTQSPSTWEEVIEMGIRYLALCHGLLFTSLSVSPHTFDIEITGGEVGPGNILYVSASMNGSLPASPLSALESAIPFFQSRLPTLDLAPLKVALERVKEGIKVTKEWMVENPEAVEAIRRRREVEKGIMNEFYKLGESVVH